MLPHTRSGASHGTADAKEKCHEEKCLSFQDGINSLSIFSCSDSVRLKPATLLQDEGGTYDAFDQHQLLRSVGVVGALPAQALINLHAGVKALNPRGVSLQELLQTASQVCEQLEKGAHLGEAVRQAALNVYLGSLQDAGLRQVGTNPVCFMHCSVLLSPNCTTLFCSHGQSV